MARKDLLFLLFKCLFTDGLIKDMVRFISQISATDTVITS